MDNMLEVSVSNWGITFNSAPLYMNISWGVVIVMIGGYLAHRIVSNKRAKSLWQQALEDERKEYLEGVS